MKITSLIVALLLIVTISSCGQNCKELPNNFKSYDRAKEIVLGSTFKFSYKVDVSNSSWINSAKYLSCDGASGFFVITTVNRTYIHQEVPSVVWEQFINADSKGSYYSRNIKGRYRLELE